MRGISRQYGKALGRLGCGRRVFLMIWVDSVRNAHVSNPDHEKAGRGRA
jgi:hypothetical protein